ncbi:MAG TPA: cell division ATP-binding protein FtsE [Candidatus Paceibacterota bacterium]|nr:cell division ATP-binding protein FtsE [Candidatus Paceibacterota bacterium]
MINFDNVSKIYNSHSIALQNVNLAIDKGEFVSVAGKSGAGKSTLLKLLIAEERPTKGKVLFYDQEVHKIPDSQLPKYRRKIGMVFQDYRLLPNKTAYENIAYAMEVNGFLDKDIEKDVTQVLELVGLKDRAFNFPYALSGGEKQRVAIARALVQRPEVIVADEPTGNLDPLNAYEIIKLLLKINELGTTVILATHNKEIIDSLGKRVVILDKGKLIRDEENGKYLII